MKKISLISISMFFAVLVLGETLSFVKIPVHHGQLQSELAVAVTNVDAYFVSASSPSNFLYKFDRTLTPAERTAASNTVSVHGGVFLKSTNQVSDEVLVSNSIFNVQVEIERSVTNHVPYPKGLLKALRSDVNSYLSDVGTTTPEWKRAMRKAVRSESLRNEFITTFGRDAIFSADFGTQN